jgi:phage head maturation protease
MKNKISNDFLAFIEEKLEVKFENIAKDENNFIYRKQLTDGLVLDPNDERCIIAKISTIDVDRAGEIVIPEGCKYNDFLKNPLVYLNHNYAINPIGRIEKLQVTPIAVYAKIKLATTEMAEEVWTLIREKCLNACSIGFNVIKSVNKGTKEFNDYVKFKFNGAIENIENITKIITEWDLLENSIVGLPCNQEALIQYVSTKGMSEKLCKELNVQFKELKNESELEYKTNESGQNGTVVEGNTNNEPKSATNIEGNTINKQPDPNTNEPEQPNTQSSTNINENNKEAVEPVKTEETKEKEEINNNGTIIEGNTGNEPAIATIEPKPSIIEQIADRTNQPTESQPNTTTEPIIERYIRLVRNNEETIKKHYKEIIVKKLKGKVS